MTPETFIHTDSYWTLLPVIVKEKILEYKNSQELIEWRESEWNCALREQIRKYAELREKWAIGFIQCLPVTRRCRYRPWISDEDERGGKCMRIYGFYWDTMCVKRKCFLAFNLDLAIANCNYRKVLYNRIWASFPRE